MHSNPTAQVLKVPADKAARSTPQSDMRALVPNEDPDRTWRRRIFLPGRRRRRPQRHPDLFLQASRTTAWLNRSCLSAGSDFLSRQADGRQGPRAHGRPGHRPRDRLLTGRRAEPAGAAGQILRRRARRARHDAGRAPAHTRMGPASMLC